MENEIENEEFVITPAGYAVLALAGAAVFAASMGIGHVTHKVGGVIYDRIAAKKYPNEKKI